MNSLRHVCVNLFKVFICLKKIKESFCFHIFYLFIYFHSNWVFFCFVQLRVTRKLWISLLFWVHLRWIVRFTIHEWLFVFVGKILVFLLWSINYVYRNLTLGLFLIVIFILIDSACDLITRLIVHLMNGAISGNIYFDVALPWLFCSLKVLFFI